MVAHETNVQRKWTKAERIKVKKGETGKEFHMFNMKLTAPAHSGCVGTSISVWNDSYSRS